MRILIVSDAWEPQQNGVVRTLTETIQRLKNRNHEIKVIHPNLFKTIKLPFYKEIEISYRTPGIFKIIKDFNPNAIHISTEGPLGLRVRNWCVKHTIPFTTAYHTKFPEYLYEHFRIPTTVGYKYLRWFHSKSRCVMVNTASLMKELKCKGFNNLSMWSRGVDFDLFKPMSKSLNLKSPVWLNVGRVSHEKNLRSFLDLPLPGTKVIVGDGPAKDELEEEYPDVVFLGKKSGKNLVQAYNECDVFVFPSKTDTFGLVIIEAMACGKPVAAYPVTGPVDIISNNINGFVDDNLMRACTCCLIIPSNEIVDHVKRNYSWDICTDQFYKNLFSHSVDYSKCSDD